MKTGSPQSFSIKSSTATAIASIALLFLAWLPAVAGAGVSVTEFMYDVPGSDARGEWIEIFNDGPLPVDISKWKVLDTSRHVLNAPPKNGSTGTTTLQPNSYAILASDANTFASTHPGTIASILDTSLNLPNTGGAISLLNSKGTPIDTVAYSASLGAAGNGNSLQRSPSGKWIEAKPTAGIMNAQIAQPPPSKVSPEPLKKSAVDKRTKKVAEPAEEKEVPRADKQNIRMGFVDNDLTPSSQVGAVYSGVAWSPTSPWFLGVLCVVGIAAVASVAAIRSRKEEWEILEETD